MFTVLHNTKMLRPNAQCRTYSVYYFAICLRPKSYSKGNFDLMVHLDKMSVGHKIIRNIPLGTMNMYTHFHGNLPSNY